MSLLQDLPSPSSLTGLLDGKFSLDSLGVDALQNLGIGNLSAELMGSAPGDLAGGLSVPAIPANLTKDGFIGTLKSPLDSLTNINASSLIGDIGGSLPVSLPTPSFDINSVIGDITSKIIPAKVTIPSPDIQIPGLDLGGLTEPLNKLVQAGANTPLRLLNMVLQILSRLVEVVTDSDKMVEIVTKSIVEIYGDQVANVGALLPLRSVEEALEALGDPALPESFLGMYKTFLDEIEILADPASARAQKVIQQARTTILPTLRALDKTRATLEALKANEVTALTTALTRVLDFAASDQVLLQPYFDKFETSIGQVLDAIAGPVNQIKDMAVQIEEYLTQAADKAEEVAATISTQLETNIKKVENFLTEVQTKIQDLEAQITAFLEKLDIGPVIEKVKLGCVKVGEAVEGFFTKVEELKQKLDEAVAKIEGQVDETLTKVFAQLEAQIRQLLGQITGVLERPEVKDALDQARQGIEKFKNTMDQASLKPVFDLVITQTGNLETSIGRLNVATMGAPQKTALKVGVKVIQEVKVDEIIKPELMDAFEQIRQPLMELVNMLRDKVLEIEKMIYAFNPGTLANEFILNSEPYKLIISTLESLKPSKLLAPLKDAYHELVKIVQQLDPQILIDQVQKIYEQFAGLVEAVSPAPLNRMIGDAVDVVVFQLEEVRDKHIENLLQTIKDTVSLEKLMDSIGLKEIATADFWQMIKDVLGGTHLNLIKDGVTEVETLINRLASTVDFSGPLLLLQNTITAIENQITIDAAIFNGRLAELTPVLAASNTLALQFQDRRAALLTRYQDEPAISALLTDLDLAPIIALNTAALTVSGMSKTALNASLRAIKQALQAQINALKQFTETIIQDAVPTIFKKQLSDPIRNLVAAIQAKLQPFQDAVQAIQNILITLTTLPARIDASVGQVLDTVRDSLRTVIGGVLDTLRTFQASLVNVLNTIYAKVKKIVDELSPYWVLNSFAPGDFAGNTDPKQGMLAFAARIRNPGTDTIAALLQSKLTADELASLKSETTTLREGNRANVIKALNAALLDPLLATPDEINALKTALDAQRLALQDKLKPAPAGSTPTEAERAQRIADTKKLYRLTALRRQLMDTSVKYNSGRDRRNNLIRLNRILLEGAYPDDVAMSLQSLHPYLVEQIAGLYPDQTVQRLDNIHATIVTKIKGLPDQLIRAPLDEEFDKIKTILKTNFDISGIFTVIDRKLAGMDQDLAEGLDRLSVSYNRLLGTLDRQLAA